MMLHYVTSWLDILLLAVITWTAYDALRQLHPRYQPIRAITFAFISIGGFGWIMFDLHGNVVPWWALVFHMGIAMHSVIRFFARNSMEGFFHIGFDRHPGERYVGRDRRHR
jgi:hypothetical protein